MLAVLLTELLFCDMFHWRILFILMLYIGSAFCWLGLIRSLPIGETEQKNSTTKASKKHEMSGCRKDKHCQPQQFCHRYEKYCANCLTEGQKCRRNKMCCRSMECAGGKCRRKIRLGTRGALCTKDRDCNYGNCCAREKGQLVCKPMLGENASCGIPEGGRKYLWSHQCPCAYGLKCKKMKRKREGILHLFQEWNGHKGRKCVRSPYVNT